MLDRSLQGINYFTVGGRITTEVVGISGPYVFIDIGGKREGFIDYSEFVDENGVASVKPGDKIEAFFLGTYEGMMKFTTLIEGHSINTIGTIGIRLKNGRELFIVVTDQMGKEALKGFERITESLRSFGVRELDEVREIRSMGFEVMRQKNWLE